MVVSFVFEDTRPSISTEDLLCDIRQVARKLDVVVLPQRLYRAHGQFSTTAIKNRFGSWNAAVNAAGLAPASLRDIHEDELFDNLREVWATLRRQPRKREMVSPLSKYTHHPYTERHGGWLNAIRAFLIWTEQDEIGSPDRPLRAPPRGPR